MDVVDEKLIFLDRVFSSKDDVFKHMAKVAFEEGILACDLVHDGGQTKCLGCRKCEKAYYDGIWEREAEGTTGVGEGIAIPHAKIVEVRNAKIIVTFLKDELEWESLDDQPVKLTIGLAIPEKDKGTLHIEILTKVASNLIEDDFREALLDAKDTETAYNLLKSVI